MVSKNTEEKSEIDNENYVVVTEELVVDGVATFMARCILANPKSMVYGLIMICFFVVINF